jgi:uncharacterized repeat protein (TIGR04076 family)
MNTPNENAAISAQEQGMENIIENYRCRITVLRKDFHTDLYQQHPYGHAAPCGRLEVGQVFLTDNRWDPPAGFCTWAWRDLLPVIHSIHGGHPVTMTSCCTDGLRPVTFLLERVPAM